MKKHFFALCAFSLFGITNAFSATRKLTIVNYEVHNKVKQWLPGTVVVEEGDDVELTLINHVPSGPHGFAIADYKIKEVVKKGEKKVVKFKADKVGVFRIKCHMHPPHVGGQLVVQKK